MTEPRTASSASPPARPQRAGSPTLIIAGVDLRRRLRNRSALIMGFIGPLALAAVFGLLIGATTSVSFTIGLVDADGSEISRSLISALTDPPDEAGGGEGGGEEGGAVRFTVIPDAAAADTQVSDEDVDAAIVLPAGFGAAVTAGESTAIDVLRHPDNGVAAQVAESVADTLAASFNQVGLTLAAVAEQTGRPPTEAQIAAAREAEAVLRIGDTPIDATGVDHMAYYGAAMSILFLFFSVGFVARSLVVDRDSGVLDRIVAAPVRPAQVIAGRALSTAILGVAGFGTVWAVTTLAFGADWGAPAGVLPLIVATVLAVAGVTILVASFGRTERQVDAYTSLVAFVLALAGGNFMGPGPVPDAMRVLALFTPNGWALRTFSDLSAGVADARSVGLALVILLVIGLLTAAIGLLRVRRTVFR